MTLKVAELAIDGKRLGAVEYAATFPRALRQEQEALLLNSIMLISLTHSTKARRAAMSVRLLIFGVYTAFARLQHSLPGVALTPHFEPPPDANLLAPPPYMCRLLASYYAA